MKSERSSKASVDLKAEKPISKPKEEEEKGRVSLNESLKSSESSKSKLSKRKLKQEAKKHKTPMGKEVSETPTKEETKVNQNNTKITQHFFLFSKNMERQRVLESQKRLLEKTARKLMSIREASRATSQSKTNQKTLL